MLANLFISCFLNADFYTLCLTKIFMKLNGYNSYQMSLHKKYRFIGLDTLRLQTYSIGRFLNIVRYQFLSKQIFPKNSRIDFYAITIISLYNSRVYIMWKSKTLKTSIAIKTEVRTIKTLSTTEPRDQPSEAQHKLATESKKFFE